MTESGPDTKGQEQAQAGSAVGTRKHWQLLGVILVALVVSEAYAPV